MGSIYSIYYSTLEDKSKDISININRLIIVASMDITIMSFVTTIYAQF